MCLKTFANFNVNVDEIQDFTQFDQNVELLRKGKQAAFASPVVNVLLYVSLTIC